MNENSRYFAYIPNEISYLVAVIKFVHTYVHAYIYYIHTLLRQVKVYCYICHIHLVSVHTNIILKKNWLLSTRIINAVKKRITEFRRQLTKKLTSPRILQFYSYTYVYIRAYMHIYTYIYSQLSFYYLTPALYGELRLCKLVECLRLTSVLYNTEKFKTSFSSKLLPNSQVSLRVIHAWSLFYCNPF